MLKKVIWLGTVSMKAFRGIEPGRSRVVDARTITPAVLSQHGHQMVVTDKDGEVVEYIGKSVNIHKLKKLYPGVIIPENKQDDVELSVAAPELPEDPVDTDAEELEALSNTIAQVIDEVLKEEVKETPQPISQETEEEKQNVEEKVKSKKGRKNKSEAPKDLTNDGTVDFTVE